MDLLDRYLQAVRFFLPRGSQDDIVRELEEDLRAQMEERESALGRALTDEERAGILKRQGHPMLVAGRYRTHQRLIGTALFPMYGFALKLGLAVCLLVTTVLAAVRAMMDGDIAGHVVRALVAYPGRALTVFAWTTLSFAVLDYAMTRANVSGTWDPNTLPRVQPHGSWTSRFNSLAELIATVVALVWLLLIPSTPVLVMGPAALVLQPTAVWSAVYLPFVAVTCATAAIALVTFRWPYWTPARSVARIAVHVSSFTLFTVLLHAGQWVTARPDAIAHGGPSVDRLADVANTCCQIGLAIASVVALVEIVREVLRWRARRGPSAPDAATVSR